jgi:hypothetical protein
MEQIQRVASGFWVSAIRPELRKKARSWPDKIYRATQAMKNLMHNGALEPCPDTTRTPG